MNVKPGVISPGEQSLRMPGQGLLLTTLHPVYLGKVGLGLALPTSRRAAQRLEEGT